MHNYSLVIDTNKTPQYPVPMDQAEQLLKNGQAAVFRRLPFVIILKAVCEEVEPTIKIKLDPGSKTTGIALVMNDQCIWGANLLHRGQLIKDNLETRRAIRRNRRSRKTRYRPARLLNRTRDEGWLPPSLNHRVATTMTWVNRLRKWTPIKSIAVELAKFDMQLMENPDISGIDYQKGTLFDYEVWEYLLERDGRKCIYCDIENVRLERDHVIPRSKGGSNRISNLVVSCEKCNKSKGNLLVEEFLKNKPAILAKVKTRLKTPLKDAAAVNSTRWNLVNNLKQLELPVEISSGTTTKYNRIKFGLPKDHWIDAACVGVVDNIQLTMDQPLLIQAMGHGNRNVQGHNKYGFPVSAKTQKPIKARTGKPVDGFKTGDFVIAKIPYEDHISIHVDRLSAVRASKMCRVGKIDGIHTKYLKHLQHNDSYNYIFKDQNVGIN